MNKLIQKIIPLYGILPLLCAFGLNMIVYSGAMSICAGWKHYDLTTSLRPDGSAGTLVDVYLFWLLSVLGGKLYYGGTDPQG